MEKFKYLTTEPDDLLSIEIAGNRINLVTTSTDREEDIFQAFTKEVTTYMFPSPANNLEETHNFITKSREAIVAGHNLQFVILDKATSEFLGCVGLHGEENVRTPDIGCCLI